MIEARGLSRRYGDFLAVDDVSFAIEPGEICGLLGHNGAGKTTIMKMLTGYLEPSAGEVWIDGAALAEDPLRAQRRIGYLPENLPLYPELTVADYLAHAAQLRGVAAARAVPRAVEATRLGDKALDRIATLSRGYRQRVGVAQAILHEPRFLILDEPTNGLDPAQTQQMRELIVDLARNATVILSTHIMQEVNAVCDRALILRGGRLALDERLEDLRASDQLRLRSRPGAALAEVLRAVPGVASLTEAADGEYRLRVSGDQDAAAAAVGAAVVQAGEPLYALAALQRDLESVFREVNEAPASAAEEGRDAA